MTDSKTLARNTALNLAGQVAPLAAAIVSLPWLIRGLGTDRYGILMLAWAAIGYFGVVDLGLGRALTHAVATRLGSEREEELDALGWTALMLMLALGIVGGVVVTVATPWIVGDLLDIPLALVPETTRSFYLLAASLPIVVSTAGLRGIIEAHQHFGLATALRLPLAVFSYIAPLAVLPFTNRLDVVVLVLVLGRVVTWIAHFLLCVKRYWFLRRRIAVRRHVVLPLLRVGGWMTVSNIVSPLMTYLDRFFIGALLPVAAVAYYATPYEMVTKLLILPTSVVGVLFPAFAESFVRDRARTAELFGSGARTLLVLLFPCALVLIALPHEILLLWIRSPDLATAGAPVMQWLSLGVLINSLGYVAFVALQGVGRADLTGKLNVAELPFYIASIWFLGRAFGLAGFAFAWTLRVAVDAFVLAILVRRHLGFRMTRDRVRHVMWAAMALALVGAAMLPSTRVRVLYVALVLAAYLPVAWFRLVTADERRAMVRMFRSPFDARREPPRQAA